MSVGRNGEATRPTVPVLTGGADDRAVDHFATDFSRASVRQSDLIAYIRRVIVLILPAPKFRHVRRIIIPLMRAAGCFALLAGRQGSEPVALLCGASAG